VGLPPQFGEAGLLNGHRFHQGKRRVVADSLGYIERRADLSDASLGLASRIMEQNQPLRENVGPFRSLAHQSPITQHLSLLLQDFEPLHLPIHHLSYRMQMPRGQARIGGERGGCSLGQ
jgi:hypothetical protein